MLKDNECFICKKYDLTSQGLYTKWIPGDILFLSSKPPPKAVSSFPVDSVLEGMKRTAGTCSVSDIEWFGRPIQRYQLLWQYSRKSK